MSNIYKTPYHKLHNMLINCNKFHFTEIYFIKYLVTIHFITQFNENITYYKENIDNLNINLKKYLQINKFKYSTKIDSTKILKEYPNFNLFTKLKYTHFNYLL